MTTLCPSVPSTHALVNDDVVLSSEMFRNFGAVRGSPRWPLASKGQIFGVQGDSVSERAAGKARRRRGLPPCIPRTRFSSSRSQRKVSARPPTGRAISPEAPFSTPFRALLVTAPEAQSRARLSAKLTPPPHPLARALLSLSLFLSLSLSHTLPSGFCCSLSDNKYGIEFLEFEIRDYDTSKSVFKVSLGSGLARALRRDARSSSNPFLSLPARYRRATPPT